MKKILTAMMGAVLMLTPLKLSAQEKFSPYGFIQLQSGAGTTFTNVDQSKLISPTFTVGAGAMVIPELGLRLNVNGWKQKGGFASIDEKYKYNYLNADVDIILNVFNLFTKRYNRLFDVSLLAGIGVNHAWNNNIGSLPLGKVEENINNVWGDGLQQTSYNGTSFRMGMMFDFRLSKNWKLGLEADMNAMGDDWNAKYQQHKRDWMLTTQLSLTYRFGGKGKPKNTPELPPRTDPVTTPTTYTTLTRTGDVEQAQTKTVKAVPTAAPLCETIFYQIRETDTPQEKEAIIRRVAQWCKQFPHKNVSINGYADKGTGNPTINMRYAQQRANKVAQALRAQGVPDSQMTVQAFGDTVQPYPENDQNRCVVIIGD